MSKKIVVLHSMYGCESGCCGHIIEVDGVRSEFTFSHPNGDEHLAFAKQLVEDKFGTEHVADLDWEHCEISEW